MDECLLYQCIVQSVRQDARKCCCYMQNSITYLRKDWINISLYVWEVQIPQDSPAATVSQPKYVKNEEMLKSKEREKQMLEKNQKPKQQTKQTPTTTHTHTKKVEKLIYQPIFWLFLYQSEWLEQPSSQHPTQSSWDRQFPTYLHIQRLPGRPLCFGLDDC